MGSPGDWRPRTASLRARVAGLRDALLAAGVDAATLDAYWPGGDENPGRADAERFVRCLAHYQFLRGQASARGAIAGGSATADVELQRAITDGLTGAPVYVLCTDGAERAVYPKAYPVHEALTALDAEIAKLHAVTAGAASVVDAATAEQLPAVVLRSVYVRQWLWIVTTPGDEAPFDTTQPLRRWPAPPADDAHAWLRHIKGADVVALVMAFNRVDRADIAVMSAAFPKQTGGPSRLGMAGFLGTRADAKGVDVTRTSVKRIVAGAISEAITHQEARARAEQEARARKPQ